MRPTGWLLRTAPAAMALAGAAAGQVGSGSPGPSPEPQPDAVRVVLPRESAELMANGPRKGRMIVFMVREGSRVGGAAPADAPFPWDPQPVFSTQVEALSPGKAVTLDGDALSFPVPLAELDGTFRIQAVFDRDRTERGHLGPGNLVSAEATVTFSPTQGDFHELRLVRRLEAPARPELPNLRWFELRSAVLSRAAGRDVTMRAGVALPPGWADPNHRRRIFPAVYVVPGFGGRWTDAEAFARMLATPGSQRVVPQAAWVVLDPEAPLGHHGFVDSAANGPWGTALVTELLPALERRFRLVPRAEARIVTGHSSGGWSALWLQLQHPGAFGACFASSPDPVDFRRFQTTDLYRDASAFTDAEGRERPAFRMKVAGQFARTCMTVREGAEVERVIGPGHDSGEQWDTWIAMWSGLDPATRAPRPLFDAGTGTIDRAVVREAWARYDVAALVRADPGRLVPLVRERVRLLCGADDDFLLDDAVRGLRESIAEAAAAAGLPPEPPDGTAPAWPGYVEVVPGQTHESMATAAMLRWHREMREHLAAHGLD